MIIPERAIVEGARRAPSTEFFHARTLSLISAVGDLEFRFMRRRVSRGSPFTRARGFDDGGETTANAQGKAETDRRGYDRGDRGHEHAAEAAGKKGGGGPVRFLQVHEGGTLLTAFVAWEDCVDNRLEADAWL